MTNHTNTNGGANSDVTMLIKSKLSLYSLHLERNLMLIHPIFRRSMVFSLFAICLPFLSLFPSLPREAQTIPTEQIIYLPIVPSPRIPYLRNTNVLIRNNAYVVLGEVFNGTDQPIYVQTVEIVLFKESGQLAFVAWVSPRPDIIAPGQASPFRAISIAVPSPSFTYSEMRLDYQQSANNEYRSVAVLSQEIRETTSGIEVFGELRNDNESNVLLSDVVATFYDEAGLVVNTGGFFFTQADSMAPGQIVSYVIPISEGIDIDYASYIVQAQSFLTP